MHQALERLADGRLNVESIDYDEKLFAKAATASNQSTALFAAISALVGFLFAFNAMLLTVPQRRRLIADLRRDGYTPVNRNRGPSTRRCGTGPVRVRARPGPRRGAFDSPVSLQPGLPVLGVRARLSTCRDLAERGPSRRGRDGSRDRGGTQPPARHLRP